LNLLFLPPTDLEVHTYWDFRPDEFGVDFEWRFVYVTPDTAMPVAPAIELKPNATHHRFRFRGFHVPAAGQVKLQVEWRKKGDQEWNRCSAFWPLAIEVIPTSGAPQT
jgi:hypothetical protein